MKKKINYPNRMCEKSNCSNFVDTELDNLDKRERSLRERFCAKHAEIILEETNRQQWRDELGIG